MIAISIIILVLAVGNIIIHYQERTYKRALYWPTWSKLVLSPLGVYILWKEWEHEQQGVQGQQRRWQRSSKSAEPTIKLDKTKWRRNEIDDTDPRL